MGMKKASLVLRYHLRIRNSEACGAGERSRTPDLLITNELLYQLSYTGEKRAL